MVSNARYMEVFAKKYSFLWTTVLFMLIGDGEAYVPPNATVEPLSPRGIKISVPHEEGITLVAFHVNINQEFYTLEAGTIAVDVIKRRDGRWMYQDHSTRLKSGDIVYYWVHVVKDGLGYNLLDQSHVVTRFYNYDGTLVQPEVDGTCTTQSETQVIDKDGQTQSTCPGQVIFEDDFNEFNLSSWTAIERFSTAPDYEFVVYMNNNETVNVGNSLLHINPTLVDDKYGAGHVRRGQLTLEKCTGDQSKQECCREAVGSYILPPIITGRVNTKGHFAFKYGRVQIRAKLPRGDWIYPLISLECGDEQTQGAGMHYEIRIACSFGNTELRSAEGNDLSSHVLWGGGLEVTIQNNQGQHSNRLSLPQKSSPASWSNDFHVYEVEWRPGKIITKVDGEQYGEQSMPEAFDKPFYLNLGLAAGGYGEFPDNAVKGTYTKPWRNIASKALFNFYLARDNWVPTWGSSHSCLLVDYVKVFAL